MKLNETVTSRQELLSYRFPDFIVFMKRFLTRIEKTLWRLAASHAVPAGSRKVTVAFYFFSEGTVASGSGLKVTSQEHN
jgi:hypothetical protein